MIRILLADDHPVVREGLRGMLAAEPDLEVVADAANGPQAEALCAELRPDIVLMDLRMPGGDGVESIGRLTASGLPCRVIVLTTYETDRDILRAVEAGAAGYLLKDLARGSWRRRCGPLRGARRFWRPPSRGASSTSSVLGRSGRGCPSGRCPCCGWWPRGARMPRSGGGCSSRSRR